MPRENAASVSWEMSGGRILGPAPFFVVGIVNVTPDSFYDGGRSAAHEQAVLHGLELLEHGADILDIGGESTRPFSDPVSVDEELVRVVPVVREILARRPDAVLSVDTTKAEVARQSLEAGAQIINDVSALRWDPELGAVVAQSGAGYVLMHSLGTPKTMQAEPVYKDVIDDIRSFFEERLEALDRLGVPSSRVTLDPGIGFGKTLEHNLQILHRIEEFQDVGLPIYMGLSNKSVWKGLLGRDGQDRNFATLAATVALYGKGIRIHRVHEVWQTRDALTVAHVLQHGYAGD